MYVIRTLFGGFQVLQIFEFPVLTVLCGIIGFYNIYFDKKKVLFSYLSVFVELRLTLNATI